MGLNKSKLLKEIGKLVGVSEKCVRRTIKNFKLTGHVKNLTRLGQPQELSYRDEHYIFRKVRENPKLSLRNLRDDFNAAFPKQRVCVETIRKTLKKQKINSCVALRKPLLTVKDRLKRRKWCKKRMYWSVEDWARVILAMSPILKYLIVKEKFL